MTETAFEMARRACETIDCCDMCPFDGTEICALAFVGFTPELLEGLYKWARDNPPERGGGCKGDYEDMKEQEHKALKRCPFCGSKAVLRVKHDALRGDKYCVQCSRTGCNGRIYTTWVTEYAAAAAWNRRANEKDNTEEANDRT